MRLFVGIPIPEHVEQLLRALVDQLRPLAAVKWGRARGLHLTLKFIGEVDAGRVPELRDALRAARVRPAFGLVIRGLGWFPNARSPRVLWAGAEPRSSLGELAAHVDRALSAVGVPSERRPYAPHVTLARIPAGSRVEALRQGVAASTASDLGSLTVDSFVLYESRASRTPDGHPAHEHDALEVFPLRPER